MGSVFILRERGLGGGHQFEALRNILENLLYQLRVIEEKEERLRRYGKERVKEYPEVIDSVCITCFRFYARITSLRLSVRFFKFCHIFKVFDL